MVTSIQNEQSNGLITGCILMAFAFLENRRYGLATFLIVLTVYVKLFGLVAFLIFLFYPKKWKLAAYTALWTIILFFIPLLFVDWAQYLFLWEAYGAMLLEDHSTSYGFSIMGIWHTWTNLEVNKLAFLAVGFLALCIPYLRVKSYQNYTFRFQALMAILLWIVIFNHKAESPTFVIAMTAMALWYVQSSRMKWQTILIIFAFVFTSLSSTDLFPAFVREEWIKPYAIKALPSIIVWMVITFGLINLKPNNLKESQHGDS